MQEPQTQAKALLDLLKQLQSVALSFKYSKSFPAWLLCLKIVRNEGFRILRFDAARQKIYHLVRLQAGFKPS